jgi:hypothetical protein
LASPFELPDLVGSEDVRELSQDQLEAVLSGSGLNRWHGPPTSETNVNLLPWRARGVFPDPGLYHRILRRNPVLAGGALQTTAHVQAMPTRLRPPKNPTTTGRFASNELAQTELLRLCMFDLWKGGFPAFIRQVFSSLWYGFSLFEIVWRHVETAFVLPYDLDFDRDDLDAGQQPSVDRETGTTIVPVGTAVPVRCRWIAPWTIEDWVIDEETGDLLFALQISEKGRVAIPASKLAHFPFGWLGDNWEGESVLRSLWYLEKAFGEEFKSDRISRERWGEGVPVGEWVGVDNDDESIKYDDSQRGEVADLLDELVNNRVQRIVLPPGWRADLKFGGTAYPDFVNRIQLFKDLMARLVDDVTKDMGTAGGGKFGTKAGAETVAAQRLQTLIGIAKEFAVLTRQEIFRPFAMVNGLNPTRMPTMDHGLDRIPVALAERRAQEGAREIEQEGAVA